jgi:toxin ParE1/3/4
MSRVARTPVAERDLDGIFDYIAEESGRPTTAVAILREIAQKCALYAQQPEMGTSRPDLGADIRVFSHKRYVVVYQPLPDGIEVLRVIDGARDYPSLFQL